MGLLFAVFAVFRLLYTSRFRKIWQAINLSPDLAQTLGIPLFRYRLMAFVIASLASGAAGSFYAHYLQSITPDAFGGWTSIYIQLYAVLGGLDFPILGPALGALIMTFLPEFLRIAQEVEPVITGFLLLVIILFLPGGILGASLSLAKLGRSAGRASMGVLMGKASGQGGNAMNLLEPVAFPSILAAASPPLKR